MTGISKIKEYQENYFPQLDMEKSTVYAKMERILSYISEHGEAKTKTEYLKSCWKKYVKEIFEVFEAMEMDIYEELERLLPDKSAIMTNIQ